MSPRCLNSECIASSIGPNSGAIIRMGFFYRRSDSRKIQRFRCKLCNRSFSSASFSACFGQKKRRLNRPIRNLLISGVSQRRIARLLKIHPITVKRKFLFLSAQAKLRQRELLSKLPPQSLFSIQFDEMESSEQTSIGCLEEPGVQPKKQMHSEIILLFMWITITAYSPRRSCLQAS